MPDTLVWLRWAQFVDLALVFGAPVTALLLGQRHLGGGWRLMLAIACPAGLALTLSGFAVSMAAMADCAIADLDHAMLMAILCHSALGWSIIARLVGLMTGLGLALFCRRIPAGWLALSAGIAAASLAWGGHAAASQGGIGMVRLAGDIAHLWCGLAWLGALMLFTVGLWRLRAADRPGMAQLLRHLSGFALIGGILVGVLTISGLANLLFLAPPAQWGLMAATPYGMLILAKLVMFALMFLLAAHNRFHLVPGLERAATSDAQRKALLALRRSVSLEMLLALAVVWCVAFAGTLDPMGG